MIPPRSARQFPSALVLVNPEAGRGSARQSRASIESYFKTQNFAAEFHEPATLHEFERVARDACILGKRLVVALGGDGTFQALANAALGTGALVGLLPAGGGNDFARSVGLPRDPVDAAHALLHGTSRAVDVLQATLAGGRVRCYVGGGGLGLDAQAAVLTTGKFRRWPGAARYIAAALWAKASFAPIDIEAEIELESRAFARIAARVLFAAVANTPSYGAGVKIAPDALIDDGLLDLVLVPPLATRRVLELIPRILGAGDPRIAELQRFRAHCVSLKSVAPALFHGDGEILGAAPVEIKVLPRAITIITPPKRTE